MIALDKLVLIDDNDRAQVQSELSKYIIKMEFLLICMQLNIEIG
jgi:hypothetical protein